MEKKCFFSLRMDGDKIKVESNTVKPTTEEHPIEAPKIISCKNNTKSIITLKSSAYSDFDDVYNSFETKLFNMKVPQNILDKFLKLCEYLLKGTEKLCNDLDDYSSAINYIIPKIRKKDSSKKRRACLKKEENFVAPKSKGIGLKWKETFNPKEDISNHFLTQTTYQYTSILEQLNVLFRNKDFKDIYVDYNCNSKHKCEEGVYQDFCCGKVFRETEIFTNPISIQLQIAIDDFDPCDSLKSSAGKQKMCAVYGQVKNVPLFCRSRLENVMLIALVKVEDMTNTDDYFDSVAKNLVAEIKILETIGINIDNGQNIKGTVVNFCHDNLGANSLLGFTTSFNSHFYCRICKCSKAECKTQFQQDDNKLRDSKHHLQMIQNINDDNNTNLQLTMDVKKYCVFDELLYFDKFKNVSVDILHDLLEGVAPHYMTHFIQFLNDKKILSYRNAQAKIRDFSCGLLVKKYKAPVIYKKSLQKIIWAYPQKKFIAFFYIFHLFSLIIETK